MIPFVVDANVINAFQRERRESDHGVAVMAIAGILEAHCIALDVDGRCYQEWLDCAGGKFPFALADWVADKLVTGEIRYFAMVDNKCRQHLLQLGLEQKDHKWVRLALGSNGRVILTEDIDFFNPKLKSAASNVKQRTKAERTGPCAKALYKAYGITLLCIMHVQDELQKMAAHASAAS